MKSTRWIWLGLLSVAVVGVAALLVVTRDQGSSSRSGSTGEERRADAEQVVQSSTPSGPSSTFPQIAPTGAGRQIRSTTPSPYEEEPQSDLPALILDKVWVQPGDSLQVRTGGLAPDSSVQISIRSDIVQLGTVTADATGLASAAVTIPSSFANDPGLHTIVADGFSATGDPITLTSPIRVGFDSSAPWIEPFGSAGAIKFAANTVDVTTGPQTITMSSSIFDDLSGFESGSIQWRGPNETIFSCIATRTFLYGGGVCEITGGDDLNGSYSSPIVVSGTSRPGNYEFIALGLRDRAGNQVNYVDPSHSEVTLGTVDLTTLGYRPGSFDFSVTSSGVIDLAAPSLAPFGSEGALSLSATSVDTSTASQSIDATLGIQDDLSGFGQGGIAWSNGDRTVWTCISKQTFLFGGGECKRVSGDELNGTYTSPVIFSAFSRPGVYRFTSVTLTDNSGNQVIYYDPANVTTPSPGAIDITTIGYQSGSFDITVTGAGDSVAPWIAAFGTPGALALSTNSINTSTGAQTVTLTLDVQDDLSGFDSGTIQWANGDITIFSCVAQQTYLYGGGVCTRTSGDESSGTYSSPIRFPANGRSGTYRFMSLTLTDRSGNQVTYFDPANRSVDASWPDYVDITTLGYRSGSLDIVNGP
jgi:hypothetical protein